MKLCRQRSWPLRALAPAGAHAMAPKCAPGAWCPLVAGNLAKPGGYARDAPPPPAHSSNANIAQNGTWHARLAQRVPITLAPQLTRPVRARSQRYSHVPWAPVANAKEALRPPAPVRILPIICQGDVAALCVEACLGPKAVASRLRDIPGLLQAFGDASTRKLTRRRVQGRVDASFHSPYTRIYENDNHTKPPQLYTPLVHPLAPSLPPS